MTLQRFIKRLPGVLQTEVQKEFYAATFDQVFSKANVEAAQGFIGRRSSDVLDPLVDVYLGEETKERAAYQLEPVAYAVNAALEDSNHMFYEDFVNYIEHKGGNVGNHDRLFADQYYSFAPPIDIDKYLNYQNYLWLQGDGTDATNTAPILFIQSALSPSAFDDFIESNIIGNTTFNTGDTLIPANVELTSGMRVNFEGSSSFNSNFYLEGVGRAIRLVTEESVLYPDDSITLIDPLTNVEAESASQDLLTTPDYMTIERGSCPGSAWARSNRWFHEDAVDAITQAGQLQGAAIVLGGTDYEVGDVLLVNNGDGVGGSFVVTSLGTGSSIAGIAVFTRGSGYSFAQADETGVLVTATELQWDNEDPFGLGSAWDPDNILTNPSGFLTELGQDETDFDETLALGLVGLGGTGYTVADVLTIVGGTGTAATFSVDSIDVTDGSVTGISLLTAGTYSVNPTSPAVTTVVPAGGTGCEVNLFFEGTFVGGAGWADPADIGNTITMSDGTIITIDNIAANVVTEFTITTSSTSLIFSQGITLTQSSTTGTGAGFTLTLDTPNERGVTLWDDNTLGGGDGANALIDGLLASAVSRSNKAARPIIEFKRDLELYDAGDRYIGEVDVAVATLNFGAIDGAAIGTAVDGVVLTNGMRLIFLDPNSIPSFLDWDEFPDGGVDSGTRWDEGPWEVDGVSGAVTRFVWEVDTTGPTIQLASVDLATGMTPTSVVVEVGETVVVKSGATFASFQFYQAINSFTGEFFWKQGQQKTGANNPPLFNLYDTNGIELDDIFEYPNSTFSGSEIFSYKILTQSRLNELGGGSLLVDNILGIALETIGFKALGDVVFENDLEANRETFLPVGGTSTEINGYYFFKVFQATAIDCTLTGEDFETNWISSTLREVQRVIDRYLTETDEQDEFPVSVVPVTTALGPTCLVVAQGRRLNTSEFAFLPQSNSMRLFASPTEFDGVIADGVAQSYVFTGISANIEITIDSVYQIKGTDFSSEFTDYIVTDSTPNNFIVQFATIPALDVFIQATNRASGAPGKDTVVEILTCTFDDVDDTQIGFFEIPNGLENNPNNLEIIEKSWNEFTPHFTSIITEQLVYEGEAFGAGNNYRDTAKDGSLGTFALQNQSPMLKAMFTASNETLDIVESIRFNSNEYSRFKNKYIKVAQQLINEGFQDFGTSNPIVTSIWVDEIMRRIIRGREFADSFVDTYMVAWNNVYDETILAGTGSSIIFTTTDFVDLLDKRNVMYVYVDGVIQLTDRDYVITNFNPIQITFNTPPVSGAVVVMRLFEDASPAHIPATPSKLGMFKVVRPRIETDNTYITPADFIIGHDGSRTPTYGSEVDVLLLELESRIYNGILEKFRQADKAGDIGIYTPPLHRDTYKPGKFRDTRWPLTDWNDLIKQSFFKWTAGNKADYITNAYYENTDLYTWNNKQVIDVDGKQLTSGWWRGIFDYYYDTQTPELTPWEMLGFHEKPIWWESTTPRPGDTFMGYGPGPWPDGDPIWIDIEAGLIRRVYDPVNGVLDAVDSTFNFWVAGAVDLRYARPDFISKYIPVDGFGVLKATPLEAIDVSGSLIIPTDAEAQADYTWADWSPIEYAWRTSESYPFALMEALFLARPGEFGEKFWDPEHIFVVPIDEEQIVNDENDLRKRIGNDVLFVHGETLGGVIQLNTGYQVWISSRLRTLKKDLSADFGDLLRTLDVKLGHKMGAFTDKDTMKVFVEGISVSSQATNLLVPTENINVALYTGPPTGDYFYGGVLIKALPNEVYQLFGYDILEGEFEFFPRIKSGKDSNVNVGGKPEAFSVFANNTNYTVGEIVQLNGIFYRALETHLSESFDPDKWTKLQNLPITGGISVSFRPLAADTTTTIQYGERISGTQGVFDFLVGYGEVLEAQGWTFEDPNSATGTVNDWLQVAKDYLFWVGTAWEEGAILMVSPGAEKTVLNAKEGYPGNVERVNNGVYSILDKQGVSLDPRNTVINRDDRLLEVAPDIEQIGIYGLRVSTFETENIVTFDNTTVFNDILFDPVLGSRLARLDFRGRRTLDWTGKLEAGGFIITADGLLPNYENMVDSIRDYHNTEVQLDSPQIEDTARHLIGFTERDYFTDLGVLDDAQFQFYQGLVREKGTRQAIEKLERNKLVTSVDDELNIIEEMALRIGEYAGVCKNQMTEFLIAASEVKVDPQLVKLSYPFSTEAPGPRAFADTDVDITTVDPDVYTTDRDTITIQAHGYVTGEAKTFGEGTGTAPTPLIDGVAYFVVVVDDNTIQLAITRANSRALTPIIIDLTVAGTSTDNTLTEFPSGSVTAIDVLSATNVYTIPPTIFITNHPDDTTGSGATAVSVLDTDGTVLRIDIITQGTGYSEVPDVAINLPTISSTSDRAIARINFDISVDITTDGVILIDLDDETRWITRPNSIACDVVAELWPEAAFADYIVPNAGYVHIDDVTLTSFDEASIDNVINNTTLPFTHGQTIWVARDATEEFGVYFLDNYKVSTILAQDEADFDGVTADQGSFDGGTNYVSSETIIMSDGTEAIIDTVDGSGVVLTFDISVESTSAVAGRGDTILTTVSSNVAGNNDFTLTLGVFNEQSGASLTGTGATLSQTAVTPNDGQVTFTSLPNEDLVKAQLTVDVNIVTGLVDTVAIVDGGFGYREPGSFTLSSLTYGSERSVNETDAIISFSVLNSQMDSPVITDGGANYRANVDVITLNAGGAGYSINDILTVVGGTGDAATATVTGLLTIATQDETVFDGLPVDDGTFNGGTGHTSFPVANVITLSDGSTITVDAASISTIGQQTDSDFDGVGSNGTFVDGGGYVTGDLLTMNDGTIVQVVAGTPTVPTEVTGFSILSASTDPTTERTTTLTQVGTSGGTGFTITLATNNEQTTSSSGIVTEFTITTASTSDITTDNTTLTQVSSVGTGTAFVLNLGDNNQTIGSISLTNPGAYSIEPGGTGTATTVVPTGGTGATVDMTFTGDGIVVAAADVSTPTGFRRSLGSSAPGVGQIFVNGTLYDFSNISGFDFTLSKDGTPIVDNTFPDNTTFFTLFNLRYRDIAERTLFEPEMILAGVTQVWTDDNSSALWETDTFSAETIFPTPSGADIALHADWDGADAATAFTEESNNAAIATFNGGAELDTAEFNGATSSLLLDGVDSDVTFPDIAAYDLGTGDWTFEGFVRLNTIPPLGGFSGDPGFALATLSYDDGGAELVSFVLAQDVFGDRVMIRFGGTFEQGTISGGLATDTWYHWALSRQSGQIYLKFNGNQETSDFGSISADMGTSTVALRIGSFDGATEFTDGWIDDVRFTQGTGLYGTSSYTPPTAPFATPSTGSPITTVTYDELRIEEPLIETFKFENAYVYDNLTKDTLAQIPVYDPFKGILPGTAHQNIRYIRQRDPARYTNASTASLINEDLAFDTDQLGQLWWDTSTSAYIYYEQGTDSYRRDNWGKLFVGSSVDIYEWTRSTVLPDTYDGDGTVRNTTDYVEIDEWDPILEKVSTFFYFWVKDRTVIPGGVNRTIAAFEVANIINNPLANLYQWFSPVSQTAFVFAGVDNVFTDSDNVFQINYERADEDRPTHVEWELSRDSDNSFTVNSVHIDKMVDSLVGFTEELDIGAMAFLDEVASFNTDATGIDVPGVNNITSLANHGFIDGKGVVYTKNGTANIGLIDGRTYYVEVISDTEFALHAQSQQANPIPPTVVNTATRVPVFVDAGSPVPPAITEVHTLTMATENALYNFNNSILPTAADPERGFLIVPDPSLSESQKLGIRTRPVQTMFSDIQDARRVWRDKVNALVSPIILRDVNAAWADSMTTTDLWEWVDWFEVGFDITNTQPTRQVADTSDLATLPNPIDGEIIKVTGTRFSMYQYDSDTDLFALVVREESRLNILATVYTSDPTLAIALELRELIAALTAEVFIGDLLVFNNIIFFTLLNYVFNEQDDLDWAFKTTYIFLDQTGRTLEQDRVFQEDPFDSALDYITEAKPYQTKVRDFRITRQTELDLAEGVATEVARLFNIDLRFDQIRGGNLSVTEMRIAKYEAGLDTSYDGYSTLDGGSTLVRLGAAGRAVTGYVEADDLQGPTGSGTTLIEFDPAFTGNATTDDELLSVAFINEAITDEFFFDFQGSFLTNTSFGGLPTLDTFSLVLDEEGNTAAGTGYAVGEILSLNADNAVAISNALFRVATITGSGGILTVELISGGSYTLTPTTDPVDLDGGTGTSAQVTTLIFENGNAVPFDTVPWDVIGFESSPQDESVITLTGSPDGFATTISGQTHGDYDGVGENGSFIEGAGYDQGVAANDWTNLAFSDNDPSLDTIVRTGGTDFVADGFTAGQEIVITQTGDGIGANDYSNLAFADVGGADTITRTGGTSFDAVGQFEVGNQLTVTLADTPANNGVYTITDVTDLVLTLSAADSLTTDGTDGTAQLEGHDLLNDATYILDAVTATTLTLTASGLLVDNAANTTVEITRFDRIVMTDGTDIRVDVVGGSGEITAFTIVAGGAFLPLDSIITQLSTSGSGTLFSLTLDDANETTGTFADVVAEETFNGNGNTKEFAITTITPTFFMFVVVDGVEQVLNVDYFFIGTTLTFVSILNSSGTRTLGAPPVGTDNVALFTYIEAGDLINPQVTAGITEEMVPLDPRENLVLIADTHNITLNAAGTGYAVDEILTVEGGVFTSAMTLRVVAETGGVIDNIVIVDSGEYTVLPGVAATTTGSANDDATIDFIDTSYSFRLHNDAIHNHFFTRNAEAFSSTLTSSIGLTDSVIPVVDETLLFDSVTPPTRNNPLVVWIGTEKIVYHGTNGIDEATLTIDTDGAGTVSAVTLISGGSGYVGAGSFTITDATLTGDDNAVIDFTVTSGVMTSPTVNTPGTGYTINQTGVPVDAADVADPPGPHELTGVIRGTAGTHAQAYTSGTKVYDGSTRQDIPVLPYTYWVNSLTTSYQTGAATGGVWTYNGNGIVSFADIVDTTFVTDDSVVVGDTLRVTTAFDPGLQNSYFIKDTFLAGEVGLVTIDNAGTGYSAGDNIPVTQLDSALGPPATSAVFTVGAVNADGSISHINIDDRGTGYTPGSTSYTITGVGDSNAAISITTNVEGVVLAQPVNIINAFGEITENFGVVWELDRANPGGLVAATSAAGDFLNDQAGNALSIPSP